MLKDLLKFMLGYTLGSAKARRAERTRARAVRLWEGADATGAERLLVEAMRIDPGSARIATNLGMLIWEQGLLVEGMALLRKAVELDPAFAGAHVNLAIALYLNGSAEESISHYRNALRLDPINSAARLNLLMPLLESCDWDGVDAEVAALVARVSESNDATVFDSVDPFLSLLIPLPQKLRLRIARHHTEKVATGVAHGSPIRHPPRGSRTRLRIGYVSNGFQDGATAHLTAGMFEHHDRSRFETFAYSLGADNGGDYRARLVAAFDHFTDIRATTHHAAAQRIADDGIDILVDFMGYQADARPEIAELRPAPVQVSYLGYPGTLGSNAIDYIVADSTVLLEEDAQFYAEKIVWLPDSYQVNDDRQRIQEGSAIQAAHGLPEGFVFCCFNQHSKIERTVFDVWMASLAGVPGSVLWLQSGAGERRMRARAALKGIDPARLVFAPRLPKPEHLARLKLADLFLDTHTYNAHTTSSDALWAGVPVITCHADAFAGRVAASLLKSIGLQELICTDFDAYRRMAIELALDRPKLDNIRAKLAANRLTYPLFDTARFTRNFERALEKMWEIHVSGAPPRSFAVENQPSPNASASSS